MTRKNLDKKIKQAQAQPGMREVGRVSGIYLKYGHDGDCWVYACGICTCGYLHQEMRKGLPTESPEMTTHLRLLDEIQRRKEGAVTTSSGPGDPGVSRSVQA